MRQIQQSSGTAAYRRLYFITVDKTALQTRLTDAGISTFTVRVSKNGAASAAATNAPVEVDATNMPGLWYIELTATEVNTLGHVAVRVSATEIEPREMEAEIVAWNPYDSVRAGLTALPNAAAEAAGGLYTRGTGAGQINQSANGMADANVVRWINSVPNGLSSANVQVSVAAMQTDVLNSTALGATAVTEIVAGVLAGVYEGTSTVQGLLRLLRAFVANKGNTLTTAPAFRDIADTKNRISFAMSGGDATRTPTIDET